VNRSPRPDSSDEATLRGAFRALRRLETEEAAERLPSAGELQRAAEIRRRLREREREARRLASPLGLARALFGACAVAALAAFVPEVARGLGRLLAADPTTAVTAAAAVTSILALGSGALGISRMSR
jgi:hypothetical protein